MHPDKKLFLINVLITTISGLIFIILGVTTILTGSQSDIEYLGILLVFTGVVVILAGLKLALLEKQEHLLKAEIPKSGS